MADKEFKGEKNISPIFDGREGLPITSEQDRMLEIKWAENWSANGQGWGEQVHGTYKAEVVDGFYQFKADNPDIPNWWFPRDFMDGQQLTQRAFVGWGVTQEDIDNLKEGFEKGIFDKEKNKKLLKVVNDLDGSSMLINVDTPTNVVDDFGQKGIQWADGRKALEDVNNWGEDIPILEERFIGNTNDKIILEIIPPEGNVEGLIPSEDYRLQASIVKENGDIEIIKTYNNPRQFGSDGKNFFNDISSIDTPTNVGEIKFNKVAESGYQGLNPEDMAIDAMQMDEEDFIKQIEVENNIPKGSISKMGLALDPIAEGLEFALKGIGLSSVAQWWVKAEAANFLAGLIRGGGAASGIAQLGQSQALMGEEFTADADAIKNAFAQNLGSQMKLSPSLWMENKYAESNLGKGETPTEQGYNWAKNALGFGK